MSGVPRRPLWAIAIIRVLIAAALAADIFLSTGRSTQGRADKPDSDQPQIGIPAEHTPAAAHDRVNSLLANQLAATVVPGAHAQHGRFVQDSVKRKEEEITR